MSCQKAGRSVPQQRGCCAPDHQGHEARHLPGQGLIADAQGAPRGRIELNYTAAVRSLVAAGYGAAVLPLEGESPGSATPGLKPAALTPTIIRHTAVVHRPLPSLDGATRNLLAVLARFRQR